VGREAGRRSKRAERPRAVGHDLGALELRADDERREQVAERRRTAFLARGQCAFDPPLAPAVKRGGLRRTATWHALMSFLFGSVIVALLINSVASLLR
jgi:hypothetical protein